MKYTAADRSHSFVTFPVYAGIERTLIIAADSQPVAGLQVLMPGGKWQYVRHYPNHIIVNLGDVMEFVTGGVLKALPHRGELCEPSHLVSCFDVGGIFVSGRAAV